MAPNNYIIDGERISADQYNKVRYEDLRVRVTKGRKAEIQAHAQAHGESVNAFVGRAISEAMERDNAASGAAGGAADAKEGDT